MSDTPETDSVTRSSDETPWTPWVCAGHANRLERERDEARRELAEAMRLTEHQWLLKVACRLVSAGCKSEGILDSLDEVIRERDEARCDRDDALKEWDLARAGWGKALEERDEARRERDEALQRISVWHSGQVPNEDKEEA